MSQAPDPESLIKKLSINEAWNFQEAIINMDNYQNSNNNNRYSMNNNETKSGLRPSTASSLSSSMSSLHHYPRHQQQQLKQQQQQQQQLFHRKQRQRLQTTKKKWHFMCASPDVATPPTIVTNHKKTIVNTENTQKDTDNIDIENGDNTRPSTSTKTNVSTTSLGIPRELQTLITLPALSASASEESLRSFASHAAVAMRCIEFTLRHTNSQNAALRIENDKLIGSNLELQEKLNQLDDQLLSYQENNLSNSSNNNNLNFNRDISTQNKITELTRRSRMYYRGSMELKDKLNFQREEYENIRKVLQGELDNLSRQLAQQHIIYEGRIRTAESQLENGMIEVRNNKKEMSAIESKYAKLKQMYQMEKEDLLAAKNTISLLKTNLNKTKLDLAHDRRHLKKMSNDTAKVENKLFQAETKIRTLMDENENLLNGASTPWIDKHKNYQQELFKTKTLMNERQTYFEERMKGLNYEILSLRKQLQDANGTTVTTSTTTTATSNCNDNNNNDYNNNNNSNNDYKNETKIQYQDRMMQTESTSITDNNSIAKQNVISSTITTQTPILAVSDKISEDSDDANSPEYYQILLKEQEERFNMYKEELIFSINGYKDEIRVTKEKHLLEVQELTKRCHVKEEQLRLEMANNAEKEKAREMDEESQQKMKHHYEELIRKGQNELDNLKKEHMEKVKALKTDKDDGLSLIISKFTESEMRKNELIKNLKLEQEKMVAAISKRPNTMTAETMTMNPTLISSATNTIAISTTNTSSNTIATDDANKTMDKGSNKNTSNAIFTNQIQKLKSKHEKELLALQNKHEKDLQEAVGTSKAALRSNFKKKILQFEKEYDLNIIQMKNDLKTELNKKHTTHVNRIKENHMKDIKHLKVEMKNLLIKHEEELKKKLRNSSNNNSTSTAADGKRAAKKRSKRNSLVRRSYEPQSSYNRNNKYTNNVHAVTINNKRLQEKLKQTTLRLEKLEKLIEIENLKVASSLTKDSNKNNNNKHKSRYEEEIEKIKAQHRLEIKQLMDEKSSMYEDDITSMQLQHQRNMVELKTKHMEKMVQVKEQYARNQEVYLEEKAGKYETTISRQQEYIEKLQFEKRNLNENMIQLRKSITSLQISNQFGGEKSNEEEMGPHQKYEQLLLKTPKRGGAYNNSDDSSSNNYSNNNTLSAIDGRFVTPTRGNRTSNVRKSAPAAAPTPGGGKLLYPELLSPEETDQLVQKVLLRRSLNNNNSSSSSGRNKATIVNKSTSRSNYKRVQPYTIDEIESMNNATTDAVGSKRDKHDNIETLSFEERLQRVGTNKMSPLNIELMNKKNANSIVDDEDAFSPIHLVGNRKNSNDNDNNNNNNLENQSIGFKLQSFDPLKLQRRTSSSSSTRYLHNQEDNA